MTAVSELDRAIIHRNDQPPSTEQKSAVDVIVAAGGDGGCRSAGRPPTDLGCGFGRTCRYLGAATAGSAMVSILEQAIATASPTAMTPAADHIAFHVGSVAALDFLELPYDLAIDVGCFHATGSGLRAICQTCGASNRGLSCSFAHLRDENDATANAPGQPRHGSISFLRNTLPSNAWCPARRRYATAIWPSAVLAAAQRDLTHGKHRLHHL
ncbi:MAG: class I SAM-dependent methyltransferase [Caldilineaceae bacterium]